MSVRVEAGSLDKYVGPDAGLSLLIAAIRYGSNDVGASVYVLSDEQPNIFSIGRKLLGCSNPYRKGDTLLIKIDTFILALILLF